MDDLIYEKDYRQVEPTERDEWSEEVYDRVLNGGMLKAYSEAMDKIPKIIVPEDKKNYEYLLERCDAFVKQHHGRIEGIVDYHHWHSEINLFLPFVEFDDPEDLAFLKEIADKAHTVCFSPAVEGGIRVHIFINYFDEWLPEGAKQLIEYDAIMKDERLASLLGMQDSFKPEDEPDLERIEALLERFETETDLNQSDVFYGVFQLIMKSKDEDITLGKIANLMEVLLYLVLNGGLDQDE